MIGLAEPCSHLKLPVAGSRARTAPLKLTPSMGGGPPAMNSVWVVLSNAPEDTLPSPQVGQTPPVAICFFQTPPLVPPCARFVRSHAYTNPFLLIAATRCRPFWSSKRVGLVPQSESFTRSATGSCQESSGVKQVGVQTLLASSVTIASSY